MCVSADTVLPRAYIIMYILFLIMALLPAISYAFHTDFNSRVDFHLRKQVIQQRDKSRTVLNMLLPNPVFAEQLLRGEHVVRVFSSITYLYSDLAGFTALSATMQPMDLCAMLNML